MAEEGGKGEGHRKGGDPWAVEGEVGEEEAGGP